MNENASMDKNTVPISKLPAWRKSTRSFAANDCVEARHLGEVVGLRDSKQHGAQLQATTQQWEGFIAAIREGQI